MSLFSLPYRATLLCLTLLAGCSLVSCVQPRTRIEPTGLVWPLPPEQPKIKYVQSIYTEDDIGRSYSISERIFGKSYYDGMVRPYGVSAHRDMLVICDIVSRRVVVMDLATKRIVTLITSDGSFRMPASAVIDSKGRVYVADSGSSKIFVYDRKGKYETNFPLSGGIPVGIALNEDLGRLYVADRARHRIVVMDLSGKFLFEFGGRGNADGRLNIPLDVTVDRAGKVYVLDSGNFRVQIFTAEGKFLSRFGEVGDRPGMFANPKGIAVDSDGNIYVTDAAFSNYQIFDSTGKVLMFIGEAGSWPGFLNMPAGIAIDEKDRIFIADQLNSRVQVFRYLRDKEQRPAP